LIVHGLVTNAAKHACFDARSGEITVKLTRTGALVNCVVLDNGSRSARAPRGADFGSAMILPRISVAGSSTAPAMNSHPSFSRFRCQRASGRRTVQSRGVASYGRPVGRKSAHPMPRRLVQEHAPRVGTAAPVQHDWIQIGFTEPNRSLPDQRRMCWPSCCHLVTAWTCHETHYEPN
jgi:hypothetical protein